MNSAAVRPKSCCASVSSSRVNSSLTRSSWTRNPPTRAESSTVPLTFDMCPLTEVVKRRESIDNLPTGQYKPPRMPTLHQLFDLTGRVAIVTGGSRGLGLEMAEGLAEAGAALVICARREQWLTPAVSALRERGFTVDGTVCDVAQPDQVQAVVDQTMTRHGRVDILVNNAGVTWGASPESMPIEKWQMVIDINLTGTFLFSQAAGRVMLAQRDGRIINVASVAGLHASVNGPHYAG